MPQFLGKSAGFRLWEWLVRICVCLCAFMFVCCVSVWFTDFTIENCTP